MGVRSLTSYLESRSRQYFELYQLHDCNLIVDGPSLCFNLYNWEYSFLKTGYSYDCYGGDYDKYAEIVNAFFKMLEICNVKPYIVFGGRNGIKRLNEELKVASEVTPDDIRNKMKMLRDRRKRVPNTNLAAGAVSLKHVFRDIIDELKLVAFTCEEEPNREIACLAKHLKCPVLSANSDFFVLGSMFIPFTSLHCKIEVNSAHSRNNRRYQFIPCKIYKIENLLHALNKRPDNNYILYLVPILLGSDYIDQEILESFFKSLNLNGTRQQNIDGIFEWIKQQNSLETALKHILDSFKDQAEKNYVSKKINRTVLGYTSISVAPLLKYFDIRASNEPIRPSSSLKKLGDQSLKSEKSDAKTKELGLELFMERVRKCRYPSFFLYMLKENRYFLQPNIEDCTKPDGNSIGYTIISAIHNILVPSDEKRLTVFRRNSSIELEEYVLPAPEYPLPSIEEINNLLLDRRRDILLKVLEIQQSFCKIFDGISKEWQLFLLSLKYFTSQSNFDASFVYSLLFCFIILNYVDKNLKGFYRTVKHFQEIHSVNQNDEVAQTGKNEFPEISEKDSFIFLQKCIKYFVMDNEDNAENYNRGIMHSIAEFQCVFLHLKYLNNLLDYPFQDAFIYKIFDGTFIYNMTKNLGNQTSLKDYLNNFLQDCSSIQCAFFYVVELLETHGIL